MLAKRDDLWYPISKIFDDFFNTEVAEWAKQNFSATGTTIPAVNIKETEKSFEVEVAAPGMSKKDFKIELDNNMLIISSEKKEEKTDEDKDGKYTRREFSYQSFQRSFTLPMDIIDEKKIEAKYKDGILTIVIPKKEETTKPTRVIDVK
jgi:HSP20 family protein